ncbi:MAG: ATP-binding protein [Clostridium sp.]
MKDLKLWGIFISLIIVVQALGFFVFSGIAWCLFIGILVGSSLWAGSFSHNTCSSLISLCITTVSPTTFPPMDLVHALEQVSAGNFDVRLKENDIWYEVREMNLNFNKMVKELNSIETLQSDFIQNVSHEIKTPLAAIEGYAALLSASTRDEQNKLYAEQILKSSRQLSTLTGNILKLSKLENQSIISEKKTFSLDEQIRQAVLSLEPIWSAKNIDIDLNLPEISFYGNEDLIFQIWTNLISNGIKFTPSGGLVSVKMTAEDSFVNVVVADNGIGMTEEVQKHIFDKFYQAEGSRSMEGNGLGLTLVKKILSLCDGTIEVTSQPDLGSKFTVKLPVNCTT